MRTHRIKGPLQAALVASVAISSASAWGQSGYFGTAKININPTTPVMLSGYAGRSSMGEATGVQQNIVAQAAVFGTGADASILLTVDCTGVPDNVVDPLQQRLSASLGLGTKNIVVTSTHSHSCPHVTGYLSNLFDPPLTPLKQQHVDQYTVELAQKLEAVALQAVKNAAPGHEISWGNGSAGFAANRRGLANAPVDHDLPVMVVRDSLGQPKAIITSYATHAVTLNANDNLVSGDWPGYARERIESMYPGVAAMVMIGAGADSNPNAFGLSAARNHGQEIADEVHRLISQNLLTPVSHELSTFHSEIELDYATQLEPGDPGSARLAPALSSAMYGVTSWTFGKDLAMVFMEGEVVVDYSLRLKAELGDKVWVNAYSNDVQGYIPSERILYEGGYEADSSTHYYAVPGRFAHGLEDKIVGAVHDHLTDFNDISDRLRLVVDWSTGCVSIANLGTEIVSIDAYTITSPSGALSVANHRWNSLQDQGLPGWDEADNSSSFRLTEFKTSGAAIFVPGSAVSLGRPLTITPPAKFGDPLPETRLAFEYAVPGEGTLQGVIGAATGDMPHNNLVLTIDPATGAAAIENQSPFFDVAIAAYTISSAGGKLLSGAGGWYSLQDQHLSGWDEADNSNDFRLTEFNTGSPTPLLSQETVLLLGSAVDVADGGPSPNDLSFEFLLSNGQVMEGVIEYGQLPTVSVAADFDDDGDVDGNDFLTWQRTAGTDGLPPGAGADGNGDGLVNAADLAVWRAGFAAVIATEMSSAVPEPLGAALATISGMAGYWLVARESSRKVAATHTPVRHHRDPC